MRPKGLEHLVKIVALKEKTKYFWDSRYLSDPGIKLFFSVLFENLISTYLEKEYDVEKVILVDQGLNKISERLFKTWLISVVAKESCSKIVKSNKLDATCKTLLLM